MHGKATETAIAAMGVLAERYDGGETKLSAAEIAEFRNLQRPFVSKVLTELARAGLVLGTRGPGGGFTLARDPGTIYINEVYELFERAAQDACPFGGGICGVGEKCPLHDLFSGVRSARDRILNETTFAVFQKPGVA
jgi:Rrf2 family iron-sulfur cluster assembly transcriptional regulator